jgi:hypothetical protein
MNLHRGTTGETTSREWVVPDLVRDGVRWNSDSNLALCFDPACKVLSPQSIRGNARKGRRSLPP